MKMLLIANLVLLPLLAMGLGVDFCSHLLYLICSSYTCFLISRKTGRVPFPRDSSAMCLVNARSTLVIHCQSLMKLSKNPLISGIFCQLSKNHWRWQLSQVLREKWRLQMVVLWTSSESLCLVCKLHSTRTTRHSPMFWLHQWPKAVSKYIHL